MTVEVDAKILLLDIEGTTTSISFVKDVLFPYIENNLNNYINNNFNLKEFQCDIDLLQEDALNERRNGNLEIPLILKNENCSNQQVIKSIIDNVKWQMSLDRKSKSLKQFQGHMWRNGYEKGELVGHVYSDVKEAFKNWIQLNKKIFIYSSGSVEAQKLLFSNTCEGNLLTYISGYFDTNIGFKTDSTSYINIRNELGVATNDVLFLTDVVKEANAARQAGLNVILVIRTGNIPIDKESLSKFKTIRSFSQLKFIY